MGKEILVSVATRETRIAVLEDNQLVELRIEREEPVVGNIYKGRVENVLPGMDAAFVDIGLERNAFLYVADIIPEYVDNDDEPAPSKTRDNRQAIGDQDADDDESFQVDDDSLDVDQDDDEDGETDLQSAPLASIPPKPIVGTPASRARNQGGRNRRPERPQREQRSDNPTIDPAISEMLAFLADPDRDPESSIGEIDFSTDDAALISDSSSVDGDAVRRARPPRRRPGRGGVRRAPRTDQPTDTPSEPSANDSNDTISQSKRPMRRPGGSGGRPGRGPRKQYHIAELVQPRQELMLQVVKGPRGTKGSRVSTRMSLPGRYLVLMPDANNLGVSRKIEEGRERDRLKSAVERFRQQGYGIIVRTEAEGRTVGELYQDYVMLTETWETIWAKAKTTPAPGLIHRDQSLIYTIMRDAFGSDIDKLVIDSADDYSRACEIIDRISPDLTDRIALYDGERPMFEQLKIEEDIERLLRRKVWLKSGGYLVIDQTEALTSIDVNTGKFVGSSGLSETILQTNMEATYEIARQLRLRDIGGMIVLDFIDMDSQRDKKQVTDALIKALKHDRSRTKIASISPLGLIEMTRKRTKETVDVVLTDTCPYCHGIGRVSSAETVSMAIEREIRKLAAGVSSEAVLVIAHPDVVAQLVGEQGEDIERLERMVQRSIYVRAQAHFHVEKFEVEPGTVERIEQAYPLPRRGTVAECMVQKSEISALPWATAYIDNGYQVEIMNGGKFMGQNVRVRLSSANRSYGIGEPMSAGQNGAQRGAPRPMTPGDRDRPREPRDGGRQRR